MFDKLTFIKLKPICFPLKIILLFETRHNFLIYLCSLLGRVCVCVCVCVCVKEVYTLPQKSVHSITLNRIILDVTDILKYALLLCLEDPA